MHTTFGFNTQEIILSSGIAEIVFCLFKKHSSNFSKFNETFQKEWKLMLELGFFIDLDKGIKSNEDEIAFLDMIRETRLALDNLENPISSATLEEICTEFFDSSFVGSMEKSKILNAFSQIEKLILKKV